MSRMYNSFWSTSLLIWPQFRSLMSSWFSPTEVVLPCPSLCSMLIQKNHATQDHVALLPIWTPIKWSLISSWCRSPPGSLSLSRARSLSPPSLLLLLFLLFCVKQKCFICMLKSFSHFERTLDFFLFQNPEIPVLFHASLLRTQIGDGCWDLPPSPSHWTLSVCSHGATIQNCMLNQCCCYSFCCVILLKG